MTEAGGAAGFMLEFPDGLIADQAGDTDVVGELALLAELHLREVAILPVGGHVTMGPERAVHAVRPLGVTRCCAVTPGPSLSWPVRRRRAPARAQRIEVPDLPPGDSCGARSGVGPRISLAA